MQHRFALPAAVAVAAAVLAGCATPGPTSSPAATPAPTATAAPVTVPPSSPSPTVPPSPTSPPSAQPTAAAGVQDLKPSKTTPLAPGTYTRSDFKPKVTFAVTGSSWFAVQAVNGFFDIEQAVDSPDVIAVQFARPQEVYTTGGLGIVAADAQTAATLLQANPAFKVVGSSQSKLGGLTGFQVTIENGGTADAKVMKLPSGALSIAPARRLWIAFFDTPSGLLAIMVGGSAAAWQAALDATQPVLKSITIAH